MFKKFIASSILLFSLVSIQANIISVAVITDTNGVLAGSSTNLFQTNAPALAATLTNSTVLGFTIPQNILSNNATGPVTFSNNVTVNNTLLVSGNFTATNGITQTASETIYGLTGFDFIGGFQAINTTTRQLRDSGGNLVATWTNGFNLVEPSNLGAGTNLSGPNIVGIINPTNLPSFVTNGASPALNLVNATNYSVSTATGTLPIASLPGSVVTTNNYVSTNTAITIYNDTLARTYCNTNHVSDIEAQSFLTTAWNDQYALSVASNVVSAGCFDSRFNPTNYDLMLNPMTVPLGASYGFTGPNINGARESGTNIFTVNIAPLTNFFAVLWYWNNASNMDANNLNEGNGACPWVALYNTNNWSGIAGTTIDVNQNEQIWASPFGTNFNTYQNPFNISTNQAKIMMNGQYDSRTPMGIPYVIGISGNTNGQASYWCQSKPGFFTFAAVPTNVNNFGPAGGPYNQLWIGGAGTNFALSAPGNFITNAVGTLGGYILYNVSAENNPSVAIAGYKFATDLMRYHSAVDFGGSSLINFAVPAKFVGLGSGIVYTNSMPYLFAVENPDVLTLVDASPGSTMATYNNEGYGTNSWSPGAMTNLNRLRYPSVIFETDGPRNDAFANTSIANIISYWNSFYIPLYNVGIPIWLIDTHWDYRFGASTNLYWKNVQAALYTNFLQSIAGVIRESDYVGSNVEAAFSADVPPIHPDARTLFAHNFNLGFADLCAFKPWPYPNWSATWLNYNSSMGTVDAGIQGMQQLSFQLGDTNGAQRTTFDGSALTNLVYRIYNLTSTPTWFGISNVSLLWESNNAAGTAVPIGYRTYFDAGQVAHTAVTGF
jgi:hypothetical protein